MTRTAWLYLRHGIPERRQAWTQGLQRCGFSVQHGTTTHPRDGDLLVTWNRVAEGRLAADAFESRGLPVIVTENATWGNDFAGRRWYHVALGRHNSAGRFPVGGPERWDSLGIAPQPFRSAADKPETVLLPQRGIGIRGVAMPLEWPELARSQWKPCRVRWHPGNRPAAVELEADLRNAWRVVTWGSGAAVLALLFGCHVVADMPDWIGAQDNTDEGRLAMFRRLAWAQWGRDEIATGEPVARLIDSTLRA